MKNNLGYLIIIIVGVASIALMMYGSEKIDNNVSKESNTVEIFA